MIGRSRTPATVREVVVMAMRRTCCVVRVNEPMEETSAE